jgi:hypothetical protein
MRYAYTISDGKPETKRPKKRPRCRWHYYGSPKNIIVRMHNGFIWIKTGANGGLL